MQLANHWSTRAVYRRPVVCVPKDIAATVHRKLGFGCWRSTRSSKPLSPRNAVGESILLPLIYIRLSTSPPHGLGRLGLQSWLRVSLARDPCRPRPSSPLMCLTRAFFRADCTPQILWILGSHFASVPAAFIGPAQLHIIRDSERVTVPSVLRRASNL